MKENDSDRRGVPHGNTRYAGRISTIVTLLLGVAFLVSLALTIAARRENALRLADHALAHMGLEDVVRRVQNGAHNLKTVRAMSDTWSLACARALARMLVENPALLKPENRASFNSIAPLLGVDEIHVTDAKGTFVRCMPPVYEGMSLVGTAQTEPFLPALTNRAFALAQDPQLKGLFSGDKKIDSQLFQYAGVARLDAPGLVQVGCLASRVTEAQKLADIDAISETTRIGHSGRVLIRRLAPNEVVRGDGYREEVDAYGRHWALFEKEVEGYCVTIRMPERAVAFGGHHAFEGFFVLDIVLFLLILVSLSTTRAHLTRDFRRIRSDLFTRSGRTSSFRMLLFSPLTLVTSGVFLFITISLAFVSARQARSSAEERLHAAAEDIVGELDNCIDNQLAFIGREIVEYYATAENMRNVDLDKMMATYFVDEINVVDATGRCLASTVPAIRGRNQWTRANPAKFNQALIAEGHDVFSQPFRQSATEQNVYRKYIGVRFPAPARGYVQIGFDRARLRNSIDYTLKRLAHDWHVGESGFYVISKTANGEILSSHRESYDGRTVADVGFDVFTARMEQNTDDRDPVSRAFKGFRAFRTFEGAFEGERCLCTSGVVNQFHRYTVALPFSEVYAPVRRLIAVAVPVLFLAFIVVLFFLTRLTHLVASLREKEAAERARQLKDLTLAKTIQTSSLPVTYPNEPDYRIYARMDTAREVGGDFYDFYELPSGDVLFLVADVSGKGIPAALFMMRAKTILRAAVMNAGSLVEAIASANDTLAEKNDAEMFVTAWIGLYNRATGLVTYVNAGHNPPLVRHADGSVSWVRARSGLVLAAMPGAQYKAKTLELKPGESLFLYTDGVTEAINGACEEFGEKRLEQALVNSPNATFVEHIRTVLTLFVAGAEPSDDVTMLALDHLVVYAQNSPA